MAAKTILFDDEAQRSIAHGLDLLANTMDPTKVVRVALHHAASVAALMLTTEVMIAEQTAQERHRRTATWA